MSTIPNRLREQFKLYQREGFTVKAVERRSKHYRVEFNEFPQAQHVTGSSVDPRAYKNNLAHFKRLASAQQEKSHES